MKKRILIPYASYGTGHKAVAMYIKNYFEEQDPELEIHTMDILEYSLPIIGSISKKVSEYLMQRQPTIWNFIYHLYDNRFSTFSNKLALSLFKNKKIRKKIAEVNPDLTVATHFFGTSLIVHYNKKGLCNSKAITVLTDYEAHDYWLKSHRSEDYIVVGSRDEIKNLVKRGVDKKKILPYGIPVAPKLPSDFNRQKSLKKYNFEGDRPICLFFGGGGNGTKAVMPYIRKVIKMDLDMDFLFVSGRNKSVEEKVKRLVKEHEADNIRVFGFVTNVPELFEICDFVITKPGGAQTSEALYFKKPAIFINSTGGQEGGNIRYFVKNGYARSFKTVFGFSKQLKIIDDNPNELNKMIDNIKKNKNNDAMKKLYKLVNKILNE